MDKDFITALGTAKTRTLTRFERPVNGGPALFSSGLEKKASSRRGYDVIPSFSRWRRRMGCGARRERTIGVTVQRLRPGSAGGRRRRITMATREMHAEPTHFGQQTVPLDQKQGLVD